MCLSRLRLQVSPRTFAVSACFSALHSRTHFFYLVSFLPLTHRSRCTFARTVRLLHSVLFILCFLFFLSPSKLDKAGTEYSFISPFSDLDEVVRNLISTFAVHGSDGLYWELDDRVRFQEIFSFSVSSISSLSFSLTVGSCRRCRRSGWSRQPASSTCECWAPHRSENPYGSASSASSPPLSSCVRSYFLLPTTCSCLRVAVSGLATASASSSLHLPLLCVCVICA
jgi:hypothetical protein